MSQDNTQSRADAEFAPEPALRALDGMLRELACAGTGTDAAFVRRVMTAVRESAPATAAQVWAPAPAPAEGIRKAAVPRPRGTRRSLMGLLRAFFPPNGEARPAWVRGLAVACLVLVAFGAVFHTFFSVRPSMSCVGMERDLAHHEIAARNLGAYLAERFPGAKVLIVTAPTLGGPEGAWPGRKLTANLRKGFADKIAVVGEIAPKVPASIVDQCRGESGLATPWPDSWFTAAAFDELVRPYIGQCDLIVTERVGLPNDVDKLTFWNAKDSPKVAMAFGSVYKLRQAIRSGRIVAAMTYNPGATYCDQPPTPGLEDALNERFMLVTSENVNAAAAKYPDLFCQ